MEIENLANTLATINLHTMPGNNSNSLNYQLLKLYVDTTPQYNGDRNTLEIFIFACDYRFSTMVIQTINSETLIC